MFFYKKGFVVDTSTINFSLLCRVLKLNYTNDHFNSSLFLNIIDSHIPQESNGQFVQPSHLVPFGFDRLNKSDKEEGFLFCGWLRHDGLNNGHARNFLKTELFLGKDVADYCRAHDISSKWTNNPDLETKYTKPE